MTKVHNTVVERLWASMPSKERIIAQTKEGAVYGEYIELSQVLRRLQEVFGLNYEVRLSEPIVYYEDEKPTTVAISAVVSVMVGENPTIVQGYGTASVSRGLEFAIKAAETDAIKRACRLLGIGMFLYEKEVRLERKGKASSNRNQHQHRHQRNGSDPVRERVMNDTALTTVLRRIYEGETGEEGSLQDIVALLTEKMTEKQAWVVMSYPDLFQEALELVMTDDEVDKEVISDLVSTAIARMRNKERWEEHYTLDDEEEDFPTEDEEVVDDFFAD